MSFVVVIITRAIKDLVNPYPLWISTINDLFPGVEIELRCLMITPIVNVDRPFLYSIVRVLRDEKTENGDIVPLFVGRVTEPNN